jgi:hypothetical protein
MLDVCGGGKEEVVGVVERVLGMKLIKKKQRLASVSF